MTHLRTARTRQSKTTRTRYSNYEDALLTLHLSCLPSVAHHAYFSFLSASIQLELQSNSLELTIDGGTCIDDHCRIVQRKGEPLGCRTLGQVRRVVSSLRDVGSREDGPTGFKERWHGSPPGDGRVEIPRPRQSLTRIGSLEVHQG